MEPREPAPPTPIRLAPADAGRYLRVRRRMLETAPWSFGESADDEGALTLDRFAALFGDPLHATFAIAATASDDLVATASITRLRQAKFAHRAYVWAVFVEPESRGRGFGRLVMEAAIALARTWSGVDYLDLGVSENAPEALGLYERLGFTPWGREPEATEYEGRRCDEIHMSLRL
jgi:ribosomal protein S18 acetylase RimI-like enzyme